MADEKLVALKKRFEGVIPPEHIEVLYPLIKDELTDSGKPLFTVMRLFSKHPIGITRTQLRCNTCGYDEILIPLVMGQRFHCPACEEYADNEITSVLPFAVRRTTT